MNETQLSQVIDACGKDVLRFCRITAGSAEAGDDLYQDTMLTLLEKQERLIVGENIKSYAVSVALRLWKNRKRKESRRLHLVPQDSLEELTEFGSQPGTEDTPEASLLRKDCVYTMRKLVSQLPEKYRLPLHLYYSAGLSVRDIARVLKLPENTVKSRLYRGKQIIRDKLEELEYDGTGI